MPNAVPSHAVSISPPFTFPLPNGKNAVVYDLNWFYKYLMDPLCILFAKAGYSFASVDLEEQKKYQLSLLSARNPDSLPQIVYE
jgi:hypothetical protein